MPAIRTAALPLEFDVNQTFPWALAPAAAISSTGAATLAAVSQYANGFKFGAAAALQTANQLGPLTFGLNSIRSITAQQGPNGVQPATINVTDLDQWALGLAGLANSAGAIGFVDNVAWYDPFIGTHAGFLQTANNLGPAFFNLNVLKAIGLTQAPQASSGGVLGSGQPDDWSAVDIGRWSAGIPGIITNTGTTGFVFSMDFGNGPINTYFAGGLHTTTTIGSMVFDFNFIPSIRTSLFPPGLVISLAPDLTAVDTEFAGINPPPPGTINPPVTNPLPLKTAAPSTISALSAPVTPVVSGTPAVTDGEDAGATNVANIQTTEVDDTKVDDTTPKVEIPGVNGVPLSGAPSTKTPGSGRNDPFKPLRSFADSVKQGIEKFTGTGPRPAATSGAGTPSTGGASTTSGSAGAGSSSAGSSSAGSSGGSDSSNG